MSSTKAEIGQQDAVSRVVAPQSGSRSPTPKKLPKSLVEFWARSEESLNNEISRTSSFTSKKSTCCSKYRMTSKRGNHGVASETTSQVDDSFHKSCTSDCEELTHSSPPRHIQDATHSSHQGESKEDGTVVSKESNDESNLASKQSVVHVKDDPFEMSNHDGGFELKGGDNKDGEKQESFDDSQKHVSWVWDGETHEIQHITLDQSGGSSADGRSLDTPRNRGSVDCQSSQSSLPVDAEQPIPENEIANVVHAATAAILSDSADFNECDASNCNSSIRSITFHSAHESATFHSAHETLEEENNISQDVELGQKPTVDLNSSEYSANVMANIVNAANAAIHKNAEDSPSPDEVQSKSLQEHFGEMRSNRQEDETEGKQKSVQLPPRPSPPSRRIMTASPHPPSPVAMMRRTFSQGDSKPLSPERNSFHDDWTSASSAYRENHQPPDNLDRLFGAILNFMNPSDDQSEISGDTLSTGFPRSVDQFSQQQSSLGEKKSLPSDKEDEFLNIQSWWTTESAKNTRKPMTVLERSRAAEIQRNKTTAVQWLEAVQSSLFSKSSRKEASTMKGWKPKSYFDKTSFDEISLAQKQEHGAQDPLNDEFLSRFQQVREEISRFQHDTGDGIEVAIGDSNLEIAGAEQPQDTPLVIDHDKKNKQEETSEPPVGGNVDFHRFTSTSGEESGLPVLNLSKHGTPSIEVPICTKFGSNENPGASTEEIAADNDRGFITPDNSIDLHNGEISLSPIPPKHDSPIVNRIDLSCHEENEVSAERNPRGNGLALGSEEQAGIEQQLKDLYEVVRRGRKDQIHGFRSSNTKSDSFQTPPLKKDKTVGGLDLEHLTPPTADETDVSPPSEKCPKKLSVQIAKPRRKLPKISVTTLSGNTPVVEKTLSPGRESTPNSFFHCAFPDRLGPKVVNFDSDLPWNLQPGVFGSQNSGKGTQSNQFSKEVPVDKGSEIYKIDDTILPEAPSPNRRHLLRKKKSQYSIVEDFSLPPERSQSPITGFSTPSVNAKKPEVDDPPPRLSPGRTFKKEATSEVAGQKRKGTKPRFVRPLSMSWLKRPSKLRLKKGSILDEESDFNDTTNDSSFHSFQLKDGRDPFGSPFDVPNIEEVPYPGSIESNNESSHGYSCDTPDTSFQWTAPTKRIARKKKVESTTWKPHLQGLDDTWDEADIDTENTSPPSKRAQTKRSRSFKRQSSLRTIQWRSTSREREYSSTPSPTRRSLFSRSSSLPNIQPKFQDKPMKDISWEPPSPQRSVSIDQLQEDEVFFIPPAATWEEFNGFSQDFWQQR